MSPLKWVRFVAAFLLVSLAFLSVGVGAEPNAKPIPPEVPPPLSPEQALRSFRIAEGLEIQALASEPTVEQPVCITFDDRGRLWVLEYLQYPIPNGLKAVEVDQYLRTRYDKVPEPPPTGPRGADRVIILEGPDANGRYTRSREFLAGLDLASGFALGNGGLYVLQPPYLLFYPDRNGDDRPDSDPEVLLKGFGMEDAHAFANSLTWGPDGWLYGAQGSTVTAKIRGVEFQQGVWRYHPRTRAFELFAEGGGNTWGIEFDQHGQLFAGGNTSEPLCHHVQGAYYIKGFGKHGPLHNPYAFGYIKPVAHEGFLGSALTGGFVIYRGGLLPDRFRDSVIYPNLRVNAMRVSHIDPVGSTFKTRFAEDFLLSTDRWFRPIKSLTGPDGALYVADWYDYNISHTDPKDRSKWYQPSRDTGRLWRIAPPGHRMATALKQPLSQRSSPELVALLDHSNTWYAQESRRILAERGDRSIIDLLIERVRTGGKERRALESLWTLYVCDGLSDTLAFEFLNHTNEHVRAWTIRLLGDRKTVGPEFLEPLREIAQRDPSPTVRNQLACSCKRLPGEVALPILNALLDREEDLQDTQIPLLLWWAVEDKALTHRDAVIGLVSTREAWTRPLVQTHLVERMARRYLAEGTSTGYETCARMIELAPTEFERNKLIGALESQLEGIRLEAPPDSLAKVLGPLLERPHPLPALIRLGLRLRLKPASDAARHALHDTNPSKTERAALLQTLGELGEGEWVEPLVRLLGPDQPASIRSAALQALQRFDQPAIGQAILEQYASMPAPLQDKARDVLVGRPAWASALLAKVAEKAIPAESFHLEQVRRLLLHHNAPLTAQAERLWGRITPATTREKQGRIKAVAQILARGKGNLGSGQILARRNCLNCHQLFGEGEKIAPDLTAVDRKNLDVFLNNVIDPSSVIREGYQQYHLATKDGRVLSGLLVENNTERLTLLDAKGVRTTLATSEVDETIKADESLMPEGLLDPLSDQELIDLFAYLMSEPARPSGSK